MHTIRFVKQATDAGGWYWYSKAAQLHLRQHLRDCALGRFKQADIGGDQESSFEQAFSSLAYSYVKDKSPRLIDYLVGFQLVDRNEDNTKAMGLFGFKVGDEWLYGPVFFLNGDLKGHELLYIKKQDAFVPMKENWVNYLISRKPHILGEGSPKDTYQLGGIPPDIYRLTHPPSSSKYGADAYVYRPELQEWSRPFLGFLGAAAVKADVLFEKHAELARTLDLRNFLGEDFGLLKAAWDLCEKYPLLKTGFDKFYGPNFFYEMGLKFKAAQDSLLNPKAPKIKKPNELRSRSEVARQKVGFSLLPEAPRLQHPCKTGELRIIVHDDFAVPPPPPRFASLLDPATVERIRKQAEDVGDTKNKVDDAALGDVEHNKPELTDAEREKLLNDTVLIKDKRDPHAVSMVYNTQVELALVNPTISGIYEVLEKPGTFDRMLIVMHPQTNKGREEFCTVVRLSDPRNWLNVHPTKVYVRAGTSEPNKEDFEKWFKKLDGTSKPEKDGHYLAIGENGAGTTPFRIRQAYEDGAYTVDFKDHASWNMGSSPFSPKRRYSSLDDSDEYVSTYDAKVFVNKFPGSKLRSVQGELSIPKDFKVFKLKDPPPPPKPSKRPGEIMPCCGSEIGDNPDSGSVEKPIQPGNLADVQLLINEKLASVKLHDTGASEVWLTSSNGQERMTKKAALICLVRDHGVSELAARDMLKQAAAAGAVNRSVTFRVKYADWVKEAEPQSNNALQPGPGAPGFPMPLTGMERVGPGAYPAMYPQEEFHYVPELLSNQTDPTIYDPFYQPDQRAMQMAQEAGASGQKEVFDTAMISGMLKAVRQDSLVDRYLGDLMKALDKVGRILFMFYWHQEEFEDRYGKQDLPELEDTARNAFEVLGDLTLFLKEKQVGDSISGLSGAGKTSEPNLQEAARN